MPNESMPYKCFVKYRSTENKKKLKPFKNSFIISVYNKK